MFANLECKCVEVGSKLLFLPVRWLLVGRLLSKMTNNCVVWVCVRLFVWLATPGCTCEKMEMACVAVKASALPSYADTDTNTGRCRMNKLTLSRFKITRMGSVAKIQLKGVGDNCFVLCTIWPDSTGQLNDGQICLDPSVVTNTTGEAVLREWIESEYEVNSTGMQHLCAANKN
jgi:hypothetical protein